MRKNRNFVPMFKILIFSIASLLAVEAFSHGKKDQKMGSINENVLSVVEQIAKNMDDQRIFIGLNAIVIDEEKLRIGMEGVVADAYPRPGTKTHFWARGEDGESLFVLEQYADELALIDHIMGNPPERAIFFESIEIVDLTIYGNVSDSIKELFASLNPNYMSYFGGYSK